MCRRQTKMALLGLVVLLVVQIPLITEGFSITDCNPSGGKPDARLLKVTVHNCPDDSGASCRLIRGQNASIEVDFESVSSFKQANVEVYGKIGFVSMPFYVKPRDACGAYGFNCPVTPGQNETFKLSLPILKSYPTISLKIELRLTDEDKNPIFCIEFPAKIVTS